MSLPWACVPRVLWGKEAKAATRHEGPGPSWGESEVEALRKEEDDLIGWELEPEDDAAMEGSEGQRE